ncbi:hypothetical protein KRR23_27720 [Pseudomonas sp. CVAP|uniref:hypothetical protein n=1 Tax=Pseudomonas sp. CVAP\|nr:hypothetical protein [Pseudomonas sp. CVAP\
MTDQNVLHKVEINNELHRVQGVKLPATSEATQTKNTIIVSNNTRGSSFVINTDGQRDEIASGSDLTFKATPNAPKWDLTYRHEESTGTQTVYPPSR